MCNNFVLVGRLVTTSNVEDGDVILTIGLRKEDSEEQELIPICLKGTIANSVNEYCEKGSIMGIKGKIINKEDKIELVADKVTFISSKKEEKEGE